MSTKQQTVSSIRRGSDGAPARSASGTARMRVLNGAPAKCATRAASAPHAVAMTALGMVPATLSHSSSDRSVDVFTNPARKNTAANALPRMFGGKARKPPENAARNAAAAANPPTTAPATPTGPGAAAPSEPAPATAAHATAMRRLSSGA